MFIGGVNYDVVVRVCQDDFLLSFQHKCPNYFIVFFEQLTALSKLFVFNCWLLENTIICIFGEILDVVTDVSPI